MILSINFIAGWAAILLGIVSGAIIGLRFDREQWLGGYASWPRRMLRLGHISFFGLGALNLLFVLSVPHLFWTRGVGRFTSWVPLFISTTLLIALVTMPLICFLSARWPAARNAFFIPVLSTLFGVLFIFFYVIRLIP